MRRYVGLRLRAAAGLAAMGLSGALGGCGGDEVGPSDAGADAEPPPPETVTLTPDAPPLPGETECKVVMVTGIHVPKAVHVPHCTRVDYETNPPSGGDHWGVWAAFKRYTVPVPREMYVHDMEHGGVVLAYKCESPCPDVEALLQGAMDGAEADARCLVMGALPNRFVMTPDDALDTPIAAAGWGSTYTATCIDPPSLADFVKRAYGKGPEDTCAPGNDVEDADGGAPDCDAGAP